MERHSTSTLVVYSRKKEMSFVIALTLLERALAVDTVRPSVCLYIKRVDCDKSIC